MNGHRPPMVNVAVMGAITRAEDYPEWRTFFGIAEGRQAVGDRAILAAEVRRLHALVHQVSGGQISQVV